MAAKRRADVEDRNGKRQKILKEPGTGEIAGIDDQFRKKLSHKETAAVDGTGELEECKRSCDGESAEQVVAIDNTLNHKKCKVFHGDSTDLQLAVDVNITATDYSADDASISTITATRDTVFGLPELFDTILSFLPGRTILFHAQRVCKKWKLTIGESPTIQKRLWLESESVQAAGPLGCSANRQVLETIHRNVSFATSERDLPVYPGAVVCNALCQFRSAPKYPQPPIHGVWTTEVPGRCANPQPTLVCKRMLINAARWKEARALVQPSWLKMYLTEPRITIAQLEIQLRDGSCGMLPRYHSYSSVSVRDNDGLTFETVLEEAEKIRRSASTCTRGSGDARVAIWFVRDVEVVGVDAAG